MNYPAGCSAIISIITIISLINPMSAYTNDKIVNVPDMFVKKAFISLYSYPNLINSYNIYIIYE